MLLNRSNKKRPKTRKNKLLFKNPPHLSENKPLDFAHILQNLLSILLATDLTLDANPLQHTILLSLLRVTDVIIPVTLRRLLLLLLLLLLGANQRIRILRREETEMYTFADMCDNRYTVEIETRDV